MKRARLQDEVCHIGWLGFQPKPTLRQGIDSIVSIRAFGRRHSSFYAPSVDRRLLLVRHRIPVAALE